MAAAPTYAELTRAPHAEPVSTTLIDPDDPRFRAPGTCRRGSRPSAGRPGSGRRSDRAAMVRCILDSLACRQRQTLERAEALAGVRVDVVHLVGGGAANEVLCQLTADVIGRPVLAGPVEATGIGNLLVQAWAAGEIGSLSELRAVVARSSPPRPHEPGPGGAAQEAYGRFVALLARTGDMA